MNGKTLSVMSIAGTPGYPAPEIAWSVVTTHASTPNSRWSGASASAIPIAEQLGLVTRKPFSVRPSSTTKWSALTSGTSSGTSASMRYDDELLTTGTPAAAKHPSASRATSPGRLEKTTSQSSGGRGG